MRTNNDVEGWHGALNRRVKRGNLAFYLLVKLLREEADLVTQVTLQVRLVSEKTSAPPRGRLRNIQGRLHVLWNKYIVGDASAGDLLLYVDVRTLFNFVSIVSAQKVVLC